MEKRDTFDCFQADQNVNREERLRKSPNGKDAEIAQAVFERVGWFFLPKRNGNLDEHAYECEGEKLQCH
jgi:hypothetical protein